MTAPDVMFKGIPRGPTRGYTAQVIQAARPRVVVIPCCGSFSLAVTAKTAGVLPQNIICGDVSLYSTALGKAIMGEDWRLEIRSDCPREDLAEALAPHLTDPVGKASAVLFAMRYLGYDRKKQTVYHMGMQRELIYGGEAYLEQLAAKVADLVSMLQGAQYQARDMWGILAEYMGREDVCLLVNPPRYDGGYERQFKGLDTVFDWDEPDYQMFKEADYARLMEMLGDQQALTLMYYATPGEDPAPLWGPPWVSVFADRPGRKRGISLNWIVANRDTLGRKSSRQRLHDVEAQFKLFDGEITDTTQIWAVVVRRAVGDYYHDLLIHRLAGSHAEHYIALLADGMFVSVVGLHTRAWRVGFTRRGEHVEDAPVSLVYAFSVPHEGYSRLHKLCLLSILSSWFWEDVLSESAIYSLTGWPTRVRNSMLTRHPENKTARGTGLKLIDREREPDGQYKLRYEGLVIERTREETLELWRRKFAASKR